MLYNSCIWRTDLDKTIESITFLSELEDKTIMITGAAGLVCSALTDILIRYNETHNRKIRILAAGRWLEEMVERFGTFVDKDYFVFVPYDASRSDNVLNIPCDYIIHGASNAFPSMIVKEPVETMMSNFMGMKNLLDYAKEYRIRRVLYISTSEVYGEKEGNKPYREGEYGYIDLLNPRNSYSIGKRAAETLCVSYADEYGVEAVIVRPGHIYGPTASPTDNRVASAWSYAAARGEDIVMKSDGSQIRSYCYCLDCASAILTVLLKGANCSAYNISNPKSIVSIKEMAEILSKKAGASIKIELPTEKEQKGFNPMLNSSLDSSNLENLDWKGLFDAQTGFFHTVEILKEKLHNS